MMKKYDKPQNGIKTFKKLFKYYKNHYFLLFLIIIAIIYTSFAQTYGTYMLKDIINNGIELKDIDYSLRQISILGIIYCLGALTSFFYNTKMVKLSQIVLYRIRKDLYKKILSLPISYFDKNQVGSIMTYFTNDIESMNNALNNSLGNILFSVCNIIGTIIGMFFISLELSFIALLIILITIFFIYYNSKNVENIIKSNKKHYLL